MLLLTTPDYLPRVGGLTSHTLNVEKVLKELGIEYELFHWKSYREILSYPKNKLAGFDYILNIHSGFHMYMPISHPKVINFVNGAEILFYSPNLLKRMFKQLTKKKALRRFEEAFYNIFISEYTFNTLIKKGLKEDFSRDIIFHMAVDTKNEKYCEKKWSDLTLKFITVARDVPHKNFKGAIRFCEKIQELSGRPVEFITVTDKKFTSDHIDITSHLNPDNKKRDELLAEAHFNILFSLDHSRKGFFEGFGQIVQEAGCFATPSVVLASGGLPESVHDGETGWVLADLEDKRVNAWYELMNEDHYRTVSDKCYRHTLDSHGLDNWRRLFEKLILNEKNTNE